MKTCSCGNTFDPSKIPSLGIADGLEFFDCPRCGSTLCQRTSEYPKLLATRKALQIKATVEELEEYLERERKVG